MAWVRLDDGWINNRKIQRATAQERLLWIVAITYANQNLTDGVVPHEDLPWIGKLSDVNPDEAVAAADRLVTLGLFERHERGYLIHDYADFQPLRDEIEAARTKKRQAGRKGGLAKANNRLAGASHGAKQPPNSDVAKLYPDPDPDPRDIAYLSPGDAAASRQRGSLNRDGVRSITPECFESLRVSYPSVDINHELQKYRGHKVAACYADEGVGFEAWLARGAEMRRGDRVRASNPAGVTRIDDPSNAANWVHQRQRVGSTGSDDANYALSGAADCEGGAIEPIVTYHEATTERRRVNVSAASMES